jgi:hypothetical protein
MISPKVAIDFILTPDPGLDEPFLPQIKGNSKNLTIRLFWFKLDIVRVGISMARRRILFTVCLIFLVVWPLLSAVKQVRVVAERASIYIEPSRTSSRIDIVTKGTVLNLLQDRKVRDIWYYISFNSPRYGTRISGFIQESAVELTEESPSPSPKVKEKLAPKIETEPPRPSEAAPPPKLEEKKEAMAETPAAPRIVEALALTQLPKSKSFKFPRKEPARQDGAWRIVQIVPPEVAAPEVKPAPKPPPVITESPVLARLPKSKSYKLPLMEAPLQEAAWKIVEIPPVIAEKPPAEVREFALPTVPPKRKAIALPKKEKPRDDPAWQVIRPVIAEMPKAKKKVEPEPAPAEVKREPPELKPEIKPTEPLPIKTPPIRPPRKGPGFLTLGLGYGSSFGGAGGCLQVNTRTGISIHAGVGLYPTSLIYSETDWVKNKMLWSIGLKYYLPFKSSSFSSFVDIQYGGLRVEAAQVVIAIWDYEYVLSKEQKSLWGPSGLVGVEFRKGRVGLSAALGVSYATTSWEYLKTQVSLVFDTGLVFHF